MRRVRGYSSCGRHGFSSRLGVDVDQRTVADGVVSHASAAAVYGVGLLEPVRYEFSVPMPRRVRSRRDDVVIHRVGLRADEVDWVDEILVTVPTRMVGDLAAQSMDGEHLAGIVADLLDKSLLVTRIGMVARPATATSCWITCSASRRVPRRDAPGAGNVSICKCSGVRRSDHRAPSTTSPLFPDTRRRSCVGGSRTTGCWRDCSTPVHGIGSSRVASR